MTSDRSIDFSLDKNQGILDQAQKDFLSAQLNFKLQSVVNIRQVHGNRVILVDKLGSLNDSLEEADGLVTKVNNLPLAVRTADCLPIFFYDSSSESIGLIHAGWRGSQKGIVGEALTLMRQFDHFQINTVKIVLGPAIRACCYQVSGEFLEHFPQETVKRLNNYYLDLPLVNKHQLMELGVREENIFDCGVCTCCQEEYFSYRREGAQTGRMISVAILRGEV